jgi:hypothetical protein
MISRQRVLRQRDGHQQAAERAGSPWADNNLVIPGRPAVGRYGDGEWIFPADRPSGRPTKLAFEAAGMFPDPEWQAVARDLAMALLGRRPGRTQLARSHLKPVSVIGAVRRIATIGRWAAATGHGLPDEWTADTVDAFVVAYHNSRLPSRVSDDNPKSEATTRLTLANYLNVIAGLHEHRHQLSHGMTARPWATWPAAGAWDIAGVAEGAEAATAIIDPDVWWAAVRAALGIVNTWAPDVIRAWHAYHAAQERRSLTWGAEARAALQRWADDPHSLLPVDDDGRVNWEAVASWCGLKLLRTADGEALRRSAAARMVAEERTTRCWWPAPVAGQDHKPAWTACMTTSDLFTLASVTRNAALVVLAALSAMRDSELQELRRGCVEFQDGSWALRSTVQKGRTQAQPAVWWVTPVTVTAIHVLEELVRPISVFTVGPTDEETPSDHIVCTLGRQGNCGRAGLATGGSAFSRFTSWIDDHAEQFGFDPIGQDISPHQFRRTFAVIAAWQPDGHVAVELQLKDTAEVAARYYGNHDRKWFEAYELAKAEARVASMRAYSGDGEPPDLAGPGGPGFAMKALAVHTASNHPLLDAAAARDAHEQAAAALAEHHRCGDGWDCAGDIRHARCVIAQAARTGTNIDLHGAQPSSGLCFDLGGGPQGACRNVILDPPVHLAFWDIEAARLEHAARVETRPLMRQRLTLELDGARACITEMEVACRRNPGRLIRRFTAERLRLIERLTDERHAPGTAALYRPLLVAQEERITWLTTLQTTGQSPSPAEPEEHPSRRSVTSTPPSTGSPRAAPASPTANSP